MSKICKVEGCKKSADYKDNGHLGYCCGHYKKYKKYGAPEISHVRKRRRCVCDGCQDFVYGHNLCSKHYQRWRKYGNPYISKIDRETGLQKQFPNEYRIYTHLKDRCQNPKCKRYSYYGGRGIKICDRWQGAHGFAHFIEDMGPRPKGEFASGTPKFSIDRIDNEKGYSPKNCRWADKRTQALNTRRSVKTPHIYKRRNGFVVSMRIDGRSYWKYAKTEKQAILLRKELEAKCKPTY